MARKTGKTEAAPTIKEVPVAQITMDKALQPRAALTGDAVSEYAEVMSEGGEMPPCTVVYDGRTYWLCDGFHRVTAAQRLKWKNIRCEVIEGDREYAMWMAAAANLKHGVRRTNGDKVRAVMMALLCRPGESDRSIGKHCAVSAEMVRQRRLQAEAVAELDAVAEDAVAEAVEDGVVSDDDPVVARMVAAESAIKATMDAVDEALQSVEALLQTEHAAFVSQQRVKTDLKNAKTALRQSLPHEVCPLCGGAGCETCRNTGWVTKQQWDLIPPSQKG
jgi:ParB-like chromosome segregation protein Spo0J